jgi:hypothetical protein
LIASDGHLVNALAELSALGVAFISLRDNIDLSTPSGRLMFSRFVSLNPMVNKQRLCRFLSEQPPARGEHPDPVGLFHLGKRAGEETPGWLRIGGLNVGRASVSSPELSRTSS